MTTLIVTWTEDITGIQCKSYFSEIQEQYMDIHSIDGLDASPGMWGTLDFK